VYALYDCMTDLSFVTDPPFDFPDGAGGGGVSDAAFIKATRTIGGRDTVEEYMACGLLLQSMSFELGEVADGEMPVSKLPVQMLDFLVTGPPEKTNGQFRARVELATANVIGRYTRREHKACIEALPNQGRVNRGFKHVGVPYRPRLEPAFEANEEAARKSKQNDDAWSLTKRAKVSG
jgi:hypothetical protein